MMMPVQKKPRRCPRTTNTCRPEIREAIARRQRTGEPLTVRSILRETGGSNKTILEELELAGVKSSERREGARQREDALRTLLAQERQARVAAESEAKVAREMYDELVARVEFNLRKSEERAVRVQDPPGGSPQVVVKEVRVPDELSEARIRRLTHENATQVKRIDQLLARLRKHEPDAD